MPDVVSICNRALDLVGGDANLISIEDDTAPGRLCRRNYAQARDTALQAYPWNCALRRAALPATVTVPAWGWAYRFALPEGPDEPYPYCLRVWRIEDSETWWEGDQYRREGRFILTDRPAPLNIVYIARVDEGQFDPLFAEVVSAKLAIALGAALSRSASLLETLQNYHVAAAREARGADAREGTPERVEFRSSWLRSRYGRGAGPGWSR